MPLYGVGIDMVDVKRFKSAMERRGKRLLKRLFTERELRHCLGKRRPEIHLSARFAAKVSLFKALGGGKRAVGTGAGFRFTEVEVLNDKLGRPVLKFKAGSARKGLRFNVTISHTDSLSVAQTIIEKIN